MDNKIKSYFDNLKPGRLVELIEAKDPEAFKQAAFDYIDLYGHSIGFVNDYQAIFKYPPIPQNNRIGYFIYQIR